MGLIESEWLATLATIEADEVIYQDFCECAHKLAAELRADGCDMIIALTHSRVPNDERLAQECPVRLQPRAEHISKTA
jgi:5'-nucleotidase